jgi:hypothetical protein
MKIIVLPLDGTEILDWLESTVGRYINTSSNGILKGNGWNLEVYNDYDINENYVYAKQKVWIDDDNLATEFVLRFK